MRRLALLLLVLALPGLVVACGGATEKGTEPETVEGTPGGTQGTDTQGEETQEGETEQGETQEGETQEAAEGDPEAGKEVFASAGCGTCHVFEPAGSSGTVGPNLDEAKPSYDEAYDQIANGGGGMPAFKDQLDEKQIADVAAFVAGSGGG